MLKRFLIMTMTTFMLSNCAKEAMLEEPIINQADEINQPSEESPTEAQAETTPPVAVEDRNNTEASEETLTQVESPEAPVIENEISTMDTPETTEMDSVEVFYMIRPNDYLVKIAINEYGRPTMWRKIWKWNYNMIGENPNIIYPYRELSLKKPIEYAVKTEFTYYDYVVKTDDTLWSIAKEEYGNNLSWIVILRDNYDEISDDYNNLKENTVLKLRSKLY